MCKTCDIQINQAAAYAYDPTRTTTLRNRWVADFNRRFKRLSIDIRNRVGVEDYYGLGVGNNIQTNTFPFPNNQSKIDDFTKWLYQQVNDGFLTTTNIGQAGPLNAWQNVYISDSYQRGVIRARQEMIKAGIQVPPMNETGGIQASMQTPIHADRLAALFNRDYALLKGITDDMSRQISITFAQGIADGVNPNALASDLVKVINGGTLDLKIEYINPRTGNPVSYIMPAKRRATIMARTEVIRAHHLANIAEYKNWGQYNIVVKAEFRSAGDTRVCPDCEALDGNVFTIAQIEPMIPVHPQCRCIALPTLPIKTKK